MTFFDATKEGYLSAQIDGRLVLFTSMRLDREIISTPLFCYDIRDSDRLDGCFKEVRLSVRENHLGTVLCREPFPLGEGGSYYPKNWGYSGGMTLEEFQRHNPGQISA